MLSPQNSGQADHAMQGLQSELFRTASHAQIAQARAWALQDSS